MNDALVWGEVSYKHSYTCARCRTTKDGTARRADVSDINTLRRSGHGMPYGWTSRHNGTFTCPACK